MKSNLENEAVNEVIDCGEVKVLDMVTYEKDGKMVTEEILELQDPEGRASTITVRHKAGSHYLDVTFSGSGHGSNVWCDYRVGSRRSDVGGDFNMGWKSTTYAKDVERRFTSVYVGYPPKPVGVGWNHEYRFEKRIFSTSTSATPIRTYTWSRYLVGTDTTN